MTILPLTSVIHDKENQAIARHGLTRSYSVSSEIIPQTLTHPDEVGEAMRRVKTPTDISSAPRWSQVGFQSIFQGSNYRRLSQSYDTSDNDDDSEGGYNADGGNNGSNNMSNSTTTAVNISGNNNTTNKDRDSEKSKEHRLSARLRSSISFDKLSVDRSLKFTERNPSNESLFTTISGPRPKRRGTTSILGSLTAKTSATTSDSTSNPLSEKHTSTRFFKTGANKSSNSLQNSLTGTGVPKRRNQLLAVTRKLLNNKGSRRIKDASDPGTSTSLSQFLHTSSYTKHRSPVQFIHTTAAGFIDSGKSVYSFNPSVPNTTDDVVLAITQQDDSFDANNVAILHDLLRNLPSLEENYKTFNTQELHILSGNIWGTYCSIVIELFRNQRIWQLPAKVEDINELLKFYLVLQTESKIAVPNTRLIGELEEFVTTSLYVFESQIVFNYTNETTINTTLKRLSLIWKVFYEQVYYEVRAVLLSLEISFTNNQKYWADTKYSDAYIPPMLSTDYLLLKCFRDSIFLPYYQNFLDSTDGASKSFQEYILKEEEDNGVTETDKLTLLQCFGILSTIQSNDRNQQVIEELLEGVRMSI